MFIFGFTVLNFQFLHNNSLNYILRAHQIVLEGYRGQHWIDGGHRVFTVWSAPNYCYRYDLFCSELFPPTTWISALTCLKIPDTSSLNQKSTFEFFQNFYFSGLEIRRPC